MSEPKATGGGQGQAAPKRVDLLIGERGLADSRSWSFPACTHFIVVKVGVGDMVFNIIRMLWVPHFQQRTGAKKDVSVIHIGKNIGAIEVIVRAGNRMRHTIVISSWQIIIVIIAIQKTCGVNNSGVVETLHFDLRFLQGSQAWSQ